jgi:hypothetical protein
MPVSYVSRLFERAYLYINWLQEIKYNLSWRDAIGILSLITYSLVSILAISSIVDGFQSYDSTLMIEMAQGKETIAASMSAPFVLFLRATIYMFGVEGLVYLHYLAGAITALLLVSIFGRKHILSWSGFWILSMPSYVIFNQMIWKDVLFLYLICIVIALIIKADRKGANVRDFYLFIAPLLATICLTRLNGMAVAGVIIAAFCVTRININAKLAALTLALVVASLINSFIESHYQVEKSALTTKSAAIRMVENDYMYYILCVSGQGLTGLPLKGQINMNNMGAFIEYCENSYYFSTIKPLLPIREQAAFFNTSITFFGQNPHLWLLVKYKQADQYLNMDGAFIFPSFVMRLDFINDPEFKGKSAYHESLTGWMNRNFSSILRFTFQPFWIAIFVLYIAIRAMYFKFVLAKNNAEQNNILLPVALFAALYYMSLAVPSMTNDTRYFLPATFLCSFMLLNLTLTDMHQGWIWIISKTQPLRSK